MKNLKNLLPARAAASIENGPQTIDGVESPDDNYRPAMRFGLWTLAIGFGGFLLWAGLAPLDEGVPAHGTVIAEGKRKTVQHLSGGVVEAILVREGEIVRSGQPLVRLNAKAAQAQHAAARAQFVVSAASEARLHAERAGLATISFPKELLTDREDPEVKEAMASQVLLFNSRRGALLGEAAVLRENIAGLRQQIIGLEAQVAAKKMQMDLLREQAVSLRDLTRDGFYPRNRLLDIERALAEVSGEHGEILATLARVRNQIAELNLRILQRRQEFQRDVETELAQVQRDTGALRERLTAVSDELQRIEIQAPVDGMVVDLRVHTLGGVIAPGAQLMNIAPLNEPMIIEARVPPHMIDRVHADLTVTVLFPAFNASTIPTVEGRVRTISADLVPDPNPQLPSAYLAQIEVTPESMKTLGNRVIRTGMPADVVITTGERTLLGYLLKPLTGRISVSFKEQ